MPHTVAALRPAIRPTTTHQRRYGAWLTATRDPGRRGVTTRAGWARLVRDQRVERLPRGPGVPPPFLVRHWGDGSGQSAVTDNRRSAERLAAPAHLLRRISYATLRGAAAVP